MRGKGLTFKLVAVCFLPLFLSSCIPFLVAGGAGMAAGYIAGKKYDIKVRSPIVVKKEEEEKRSK
ncbi:hypothetical protein CLV27_0353 [Phorcysia thermohydrogeniphila]|uniref:Lipoprotein n=1 Tax=Phorcysia thermohydrogeniphila TaxID=936138 RepID=A0A4R1GHL5_9BACT|nr:hypothetical protein CLV27_0353 [Phorcysia thermohydrogeniphila]